ncbi:amino acid transporter [Nocardioides phosphati]|uniref:Amino acid transporter n=1 Tax=Nocardioides phosphati TaxID=1867775 RepID=A0ABQ2N961_9ACTN|nr:APC family permease [Nocardioides phosphati]GGO88430.1 amino acid transporter [Nocardioides phosphati]
MSTLSGPTDIPDVQRALDLPTGPGLKPVLTLTAAILLTLSCVTPASSLFIIVPELLASQGSGVVMTLLVGVLISVAVGVCYSELGTRTPSSGGEYAMVTHTLGKAAGWLTFALTSATLIVIPPVIALGTADYLAPIIGLDRAITGAVVMLLATATGLLDIKSNAYVTGAFLVVETVAAATVAYLGFSHSERPVSTLWHAQVSDGHALSPFTAGILLSGLAIAIFTCSGFTTATYLAEEMVAPRRNVKWAVLGSLALGAFIIVVPTAATVLGVGSLDDLANGTFPDFVTAWAGSRTSAAISVAIAIAILNAVIVMVIQNSRVVYATARDKAWPEPINKALATLHPRFGSPVIATLLVGVPGALMAWLMDIEALLGITSVILAGVYLVVAVAALFVRRAPHAGWKMPLWPAAPILVIVGVGYALRESAMSDVIAVGGLLVLALVYYVAYLRPRAATHFLVDARDDS